MYICLASTDVIGGHIDKVNEDKLVTSHAHVNRSQLSLFRIKPHPVLFACQYIQNTMFLPHSLNFFFVAQVSDIKKYVTDF